MAGPTRGDVSGPCPIGRTADILGDRWTLLILRDATKGTTRYNDFVAQLGISNVTLQSRLNRLIEDGLLVKVPYPPSAQRLEYVRQEYRLTQAGVDLLPVLDAMMRWGTQHSRPARPVAAMRLVHRTCGTDIEPGSPCPQCERAVSRTELGWVEPWRSAEPQELATAREI